MIVAVGRAMGMVRVSLVGGKESEGVGQGPCSDDSQGTCSDHSQG